LSSATFLAAQQTPAAMTSVVSPAPDSTRGRYDGKLAAESARTGGWLTGGIVSGAILPIFGPVALYAAAATNSAELPNHRRLSIAREPVTYQRAYETGYRRQVASRRKRAVIHGGLISAAVVGLGLLMLGGS
jgi:hypothetical protein